MCMVDYIMVNSGRAEPVREQIDDNTKGILCDAGHLITSWYSQWTWFAHLENLL